MSSDLYSVSCYEGGLELYRMFRYRRWTLIIFYRCIVDFDLMLPRVYLCVGKFRRGRGTNKDQNSDVKIGWMWIDEIRIRIGIWTLRLDGRESMR